METLKRAPPSGGHKILITESGLRVPDDPIVPLVEGDGIGPDVTRAARAVVVAAVESVYHVRLRIVW